MIPDFDWKDTTNKWKNILCDVGGIPTDFLDVKKKNQPCPLCGGDDRYTFSDFNGTGSYLCRKCGAGNGLELLCKYKRIKTNQAIKEIQEYLSGVKLNKMPEPQIAKLEEQSQVLRTYPSPELEYEVRTSIQLKHDLEGVFKRFTFDEIYPWRDAKDQLVGYIGRVNIEKYKKKIAIQIYHGTITQGENSYTGWFYGTLGKGRPVFCASSVSLYDDIIIVEGEKVASHVARESMVYGAVTSTGGALAFASTDWGSLPKDASYWIHPDNDEAGEKYAKGVAGLMKQMGYKVTILDPVPGAGADLVDARCENLDVFLKAEILKKKQLEPSQTSHMMNTGNTGDSSNVLGDSVLPLGFDKETLYFLIKKIDSLGNSIYQLHQLTPSKLTENHLLLLAGKETWEKVGDPYFQGKINWSIVKDTLCRACDAKGLFHLDKIRQEGIWKENGKHILHSGSKIYVDGVETPFNAISNSTLYESTRSILPSDFNPSLRLSSEEFKLIKSGFDLISFDSEDMRIAVMGWVFSALIVGSLNWKTHLYIAGESASGKSTLLSLMKKLYGSFCLKISGNETEAGLRNAINNKALPVLFDEAEDEDYSQRNLQGIEALKRLATDPDNKMHRSSVTQQNISYSFHFAMAQFAISVQDQEQANLNRQLRCFLQSRNNNFIEDHKNRVDSILQQIEQKNIQCKLLATLYANVEKIIKAGKEISKILPAGCQGRLADSYSPLFAAYYILRDGEMTQKSLDEIVSSVVWSVQDEIALKNPQNEVTEEIFNVEIKSSSKEDTLSFFQLGEGLLWYGFLHASPYWKNRYTCLVDDKYPITQGSLARGLHALGIYLGVDTSRQGVAKENMPDTHREKLRAAGFSEAEIKNLSYLQIYFLNNKKLKRMMEKVKKNISNYWFLLSRLNQAKFNTRPHYLGSRRANEGTVVEVPFLSLFSIDALVEIKTQQMSNF